MNCIRLAAETSPKLISTSHNSAVKLVWGPAARCTEFSPELLEIKIKKKKRERKRERDRKVWGIGARPSCDVNVVNPGDVSSTSLSHCLVFGVLSVISRRWPLLSTPLHFDMHQASLPLAELYCRNEWRFSQPVTPNVGFGTNCKAFTAAWRSNISSSRGLELNWHTVGPMESACRLL